MKTPWRCDHDAITWDTEKGPYFNLDWDEAGYDGECTECGLAVFEVLEADRIIDRMAGEVVR